MPSTVTSIYEWADFRGRSAPTDWEEDPIVGDPPASRTLRPAEIRTLVDQLVTGELEAFRLACLLVDPLNYRLNPAANDRMRDERTRIARVITAAHGAAVRSPGNFGFRWMIRSVPICLFEFQEDAELPDILALARLTRKTKTWIPEELHQIPRRSRR